jgi:hypothetical protein
MLTHNGDPAKSRMRSLLEAMPEPPVRRYRIAGLFSNRYLQVENIRDAALAQDFTRIQIRYHRNEELDADRAAANKGRQRFCIFCILYAI